MAAGRPKGAPNKPKRLLLVRLEEMFPDYHPVIEMAKVANDEEAPADARFAANKEVAQYVVPKLKAVEISGKLGMVMKTTEIKRFDGSLAPVIIDAIEEDDDE